MSANSIPVNQISANQLYIVFKTLDDEVIKASMIPGHLLGMQSPTDKLESSNQTFSNIQEINAFSLPFSVAQNIVNYSNKSKS